MTVNFKGAVSAGALCLGLMAAAGALAQDRPPGPGGGPPNAARMAERQKMFDQFRQKREQRLHDLLQIRPDQENAFRAYLAAREPPRGQGERGPGRERGPGQAMTTPERLDRMAARMAERQQRFARTAAATKAFYGALNPEQRKAFDAMHEGMGHGHWGHHGFGRGGPEGREFGGPPPPPPR